MRPVNKLMTVTKANDESVDLNDNTAWLAPVMVTTIRISCFFPANQLPDGDRTAPNCNCDVT